MMRRLLNLLSLLAPRPRWVRELARECPPAVVSAPAEEPVRREPLRHPMARHALIRAEHDPDTLPTAKPYDGFVTFTLDGVITALDGTPLTGPQYARMLADAFGGWES